MASNRLRLSDDKRDGGGLCDSVVSLRKVALESVHFGFFMRAIPKGLTF